MQPPATAPRRLGPAARFGLAAVCVVALGGALQAALRAGLDRRDLPGPGGVKVLTALATGDLDRDGLTRLTAPLLGALEPLAALDLVVFLGGLAMIAGAVLAGRALVGPTTGLVAGLLAACAGQVATAAVLFGPDAPATGLAWLGVGLAWWGGRRGGAALVAVTLGVVLCIGGAVVKVNAAPAVALLALTPLLVRDRAPVRVVGVLVALGVGALAARGLLPDDPTQQATAPTALGLDTLRAGWADIRGLPDRQHPAAAPMLQLAGLAAVGALLPGPRWAHRLAVAAVGLGAAALAAATVGELLRPRYLLATLLPALVLAGAVVDLPSRLLRRPPLRAAVATVGAVALATPLLLDTLAWLHAWDAKRVALVGVQATALPAAPAAWARRYHRMSDLPLTDVSEVGALTMVLAGQGAPPGGVATVPLRDAREFHLSAGASLAGAPYRILEARRCCEGRPLPECADAVVAQLDAAGATLLLPLPVDGRMRVPRPHQAWWQALRSSADARSPGVPLDRWWLAWEGSGAGGALPCAPAAPAPGRPSPPPRPPGR